MQKSDQIQLVGRWEWRSDARPLKQQELYTEQLKVLEVRSPIDGEVIT